MRVLFFGLLRDIVGCAEDTVQMEGGTLRTLFDQYAARFPKLTGLANSIVLARNQSFAPLETPLEHGDEVAFLPPVSGGADSPYTHLIEDENGNFFALTRVPIDVQSINRRLLAGTDGAICAFEGVVRNNTKGRATKFLDYECYEAMAVKMMAELGREIAGQHAVGRIAMVHRLGRMEIGEASVLISVTAPHRRPSFEAALEGINRLKKLVPIWKKEHFVDGEVWVDGEWDDALVRASQPAADSATQL
ncbi:MAG: molybdenum cofactor biosynthesis protein MoaE [Acidobacteria bacterium]|nr:molybdenum cofactor biosynthesis protein MoaE [Acidobacteriota bacterium]